MKEFRKTQEYLRNMMPKPPLLSSVGEKKFLCSNCGEPIVVELMLKKDGSSSKSYNKVVSGCKCGQFNGPN